MAFTYGLIIIITISILGSTILFSYQKGQFKKNEAKNILYGNVIANIIKDELDDTMSLNGIIRENSQNFEGRVLVLDKQGKVLADKYGALVGKSISNAEIKNTLENNINSLGYYKDNKHNIQIITIPIINGVESKGILLISTYTDQIIEDIINLKSLIIIFSILSVLFAVVLSLIFGNMISRPIEKLEVTAEQIIRGNLNVKVDIKRKDEIGRLAAAFDRMSDSIYNTDTNRRRFISDISHELKSPLASIKALVEALIYDTNDVDIYKEYLSDINCEIDRLSLLVKSLLTATALEEMGLKKEPINLRTEVETVLRLFMPLLEQKNIKFVNNCSKTFVIYADRNMFKEVLINLIDNCIKYGREQGHIIISSYKKDKRYFVVEDDGCGIPSTDLPNIFNIFYRVDKSRNRESGGSGIGLYIVKKIIDLHGWDIKVSSAYGSGTEFIIELQDN